MANVNSWGVGGWSLSWLELAVAIANPIAVVSTAPNCGSSSR